MKTMLIIFFLTVATGAPFAARADERIFPHQSALEMRRVAPTTRPWYEPDDSLQSVNAGYGGGSAEKMIRIMGDGLIGEYGWLALHRRPARVTLRFTHFRFMAKQIETDPECLRALDNPVDPERE